MIKAVFHFFNRFHLSFLTAIIIISGSVPVSAQQEDTLIQLRSSIEQTRRQIQEEKKRNKEELQSQQEQLRQARDKQKRLIDEKVDLKFDISKSKLDLENKRRELSEFQDQKRQSALHWAEVRIVAAEACRSLSDLLNSLPPSQSRDKQKKLLSKMQSSLKKQNEQINITPLVELLNSILRESWTSAVFESQVRDAKGYTKDVRLLRLGQILYAYRSQSGEVAVAANAPSEGRGYRWNSDIPAGASESIKEVIGEKKISPGRYTLPIDVTQHIAVEEGYLRDSLTGRLAAGGPVMLPLAIVGILAFILILERIIFFIRQGCNPAGSAEDILSACHAGNFQKAEQIARDNPNVISRTMLRCLSMRRQSAADMEDAIAESVLHELPRLERFLSSLAILAGVAPLLGLLGTVTGMISTFDTITIFGSGESTLMAGGISEALITTAAGLVIAIPILLIHSFLSSRSDNLLADTERYSATLLNLIKDRNAKSADSEKEGGHESVN